MASKIRRQLDEQYDRALLEFLSLYANRLRRWMERSINGLRNAFNAFADIYRANFEVRPLLRASQTPQSSETIFTCCANGISDQAAAVRSI